MKRLLCSWIQFLSIRLGPPPGVAIRNLLGGASYTISLGCVLGYRTWGSGCVLLVSRTGFALWHRSDLEFSRYWLSCFRLHGAAQSRRC